MADLDHLRHLQTSAGRLALRLFRAVGMVLLAALVLSPLAAVCGIGQAETEDYLGPHRSHFSVTYDSEIQLNLGPIGNAYLPSPLKPLGLKADVGGVVSPGGATDFFSNDTLSEYLSLYTDPDQVIVGVVDRLKEDAVVKSVMTEAILLLLWLVWMQRRRWLSRRVSSWASPARMALIYGVVVVVSVGSTLAPPPPPTTPRITIALAKGTEFDGLTVDNALLFTVLDRGIKGANVLAHRQAEAIDNYVAAASEDIVQQRAQLAVPGPDESVIFGLSDLHCSIAMTQVWQRLVAEVNPVMIMSAGDDTMNGTAAEKGCVTRESQIAGGRPFVVATGNHDSDITEGQMKRAGMEVLDGSVIEVNGLKFLGDDDPERNPPFSMDRTTDRSETEEQLGTRMLNDAKGKDVDVIIVHQPAAADVITAAVDPPTKLIIWGHRHVQAGPSSLPHQDGSWTVALQMGTAGGVKQPTLTSFSTPYSPPHTSADGYLFFRDNVTGLITGVQAVHFTPEAKMIVDPPMTMGDLATLPLETRDRLSNSAQGPETPTEVSTPPESPPPAITPPPPVESTGP